MAELQHFDVQTPSGHVLTIEAPDEETAMAGARQWHEENSGLGANIAGAITSIPAGIEKGFTNYASRVGQAAQTEMGQPVDVPNPKEALELAQKHVTGVLPVAPNVGGAIGSGAGEIIGSNPLGAIPGQFVANAGAALASSAGSEAAKSLAEGTPYQGIAGAAGGLFGPVATTQAAQSGAKLMGKILGGITTGAGENVPAQAYKAGVAGGDEYKTFIDNMRKNVPPSQIVSDANGAIDNLIRSKNADYEAGVAALSKNPHVIGFDGADKALSQVADIGRVHGITTNESAVGVYDKVKNLVDRWRGMAMEDPTLSTEVGMHDLKKAVEGIRDQYAGVPGKGNEYTIANTVFNGIRKSLHDGSPAYAKMDADYANAAQELNQMKKTFSLNGPETNTDTALRKLLSITRDNANTNFGQRATLASTLEQNGAPNLGAAAAGQASQAALPRGLSRLAAIPESMGIGAAGLLINPHALLAAPVAAAASSPRLVGEAASHAGRLSGYLGLPEMAQTMKSPSQMMRNAIAKSLMGVQ